MIAHYTFTVVSKMMLEYTVGQTSSTLRETKLALELSKNLKKETCLDAKNLPTKEAIKPITQTLIHSLMTNIKLADKKGWWSEGDHMKYIIGQLEKAFTDVNYSDPELTEGFL